MSTAANVPKALLQQLIQTFPHRFSYAFAYGSGVFTQNITKTDDNKKDADLRKNMIDLILVTDDSQDFHHKNLIRNRSHYSVLGSLGPKWLTTIQESFGAKVYFNTLIQMDDYLIKYGVISTKHLIADCLDWQTLYISGRLHKPVVVLQEPTSSDLSTALAINIESAIHSALILLSETFTEEQLYTTIAGLSYLGDFRMTFGEDKQKVQKIVRPQIHNFRHLYQPLITSKTLSRLVDWNPHSKAYRQDCSPNSLYYHLNHLPKTVERYVSDEWNRESRHPFTDMDELLKNLANSIECKTYVKQAIHRIVQNSSMSQSFKGLFTAGLLKSFRYSNQKISKMFRIFENP
ncbi:unnamed protein product [Oppiella nova]|uniref:Phosphatidate cytidylyltransferase, mitochondrial n=1 Tax=Oppiella nova TaxID=334625 RepID=A0A7R9MBX8_9ACAR|nr:unnamed protein product [Oppiella nova]CAG2174561.1 unnamed protein product [Oppiella nova]